ncbi:unnamed protein product [Closterium sp. Naga37s-1]|nr:unnamed protein product [Closterium sp. Naga37s-1]
MFADDTDRRRSTQSAATRRHEDDGPHVKAPAARLALMCAKRSPALPHIHSAMLRVRPSLCRAPTQIHRINRRADRPQPPPPWRDAMPRFSTILSVAALPVLLAANVAVRLTVAPHFRSALTEPGETARKARRVAAVRVVDTVRGSSPNAATPPWPFAHPLAGRGGPRTALPCSTLPPTPSSYYTRFPHYLSPSSLAASLPPCAQQSWRARLLPACSPSPPPTSPPRPPPSPLCCCAGAKGDRGHAGGRPARGRKGGRRWGGGGDDDGAGGSMRRTAACARGVRLRLALLMLPPPLPSPPLSSPPLPSPPHPSPPLPSPPLPSPPLPSLPLPSPPLPSSRLPSASHRLHYECAARPPLHGARCSLRMPCVPCASRATAGAPLAGATALAPAPLQCRAVQGASLHLPCSTLLRSCHGPPCSLLHHSCTPPFPAPSTILPRLAHSCQLSPPFPLPFPPPFWPLLRCSLLSHGSLPPRPYNVNLPTPFPPAIRLPIFILVFSPSPHSMRLPLLGAVAPCPCIPCMCAHPAPCPPTPAPSPSCALPLTPALLSALSLPFPLPFLPLFLPRPGPSPLPSPPCAIDPPSHLCSAPHSTWAHVPLGHLLLRTPPALLASLLSPVASAMHHLHPSARTLANAAARHARAPPPPPAPTRHRPPAPQQPPGDVRTGECMGKERWEGTWTVASPKGRRALHSDQQHEGEKARDVQGMHCHVLPRAACQVSAAFMPAPAPPCTSHRCSLCHHCHPPASPALPVPIPLCSCALPLCSPACVAVCTSRAAQASRERRERQEVSAVLVVAGMPRLPHTEGAAAYHEQIWLRPADQGTSAR